MWEMKKLFLTSIAALFLATGAAQSAPAYEGEVWRFNNYKRCTASTEFKRYPKEPDGWPSVSLERRGSYTWTAGWPCSFCS
jgi:hypothetical protein